MLRLQEGDPLVLYFCKDNHVLKDLFAGDPIKAAKSQVDMGVGGQVETIAGVKYIVLKGKMSNTKYHQQIDAGDVSIKHLETLFNRNEGFSVHLLGTDIRTPFT